MERRKISEIEFSLRWKSPIGIHTDRFYVENVDFWRDIMPGSLGQKLQHLQPGESCRESFEPGSLVPSHSDNNIKTVAKSKLETAQFGDNFCLRTGHYYPQGIAWRSLGTFPANTLPLRVTSVSDDAVTVDINHPLAGYHLEIEAVMGQETDKGSQRGGSLQHIGELLTANGPGMQIPVSDTNIYEQQGYPFSRQDESNDEIYYETPRMVSHLDVAAQEKVQNFYGKLLVAGSKVLDLMSSWQSHLPESLSSCSVMGLGLNEQEMQTNLALDDYVLHDLNTNTTLPFDTASFDAVICTVSVEYLCRPREIMAELVRILRPGGLLAITISERWFPGKQIRQWADMHPFERQGLVVSYFLAEPGFENIRTQSLRGYPRPSEDKYTIQTPWSDSLYMVWGQRSA